MEDDYLMHYGRMGMKWGKHIYGAEESYSRSQSKLSSLQSKRDKLKTKADAAALKEASGKSLKYKKYIAKADKAASGIFKNTQHSKKKAGRYYVKATKYKKAASKAMLSSAKTQKSYLKANKKVDKFIKSMNKEYSEMKLTKLSEKMKAKGEKYASSKYLDRASSADSLLKELYS